MPPDSLPWNRKDFFEERKHERSELLGSLGGVRWRDSSSHHGSRESHRWGSTDYRRTPGHGDQDGSDLFPEESGRWHSISRSGSKMLEDDGCRSSISLREGKYGRITRDRRGYLSQGDYRGYTSELGNGSPNASRRLSATSDERRSVDDALAYPSDSHPDIMRMWNQHDKADGVYRLRTGRRYDRENTIGSTVGKPFKWTRSGSTGSGPCHSSNSRSNGGVGSGPSGGGKTDQFRSGAPVDSLSGYAATCVTSTAPSEETTSRKKPRLGWGEGLAKFEKKKVDGPDVNINKDTGVCPSVYESSPCVGAALMDKSPKMTGFSDCPSPATSSSVACRSSPGLDDKLFEKVGNVDLDVSNSSSLPVLVPQHNPESFSFNLENFGTESLVTLGSSISELLQEDLGSVDSTSHRSSAMSKLLIWKVDLSKVLETTESEIDLLETELKSLRSGLRDSFSCPPASSSFIDGYNAKSCDECAHCAGDSNMTSHLKHLQNASTTDENMENRTIVHVNVKNIKDGDVGNPGRATSKSVERMPLVQVVKDSVCSSETDVIQSSSLEGKFLVACSNKREINISACGDGSMPVVKGKVEISAGPDPCDNLKDTCDIILVANQRLANSASEIFDFLMPLYRCKMLKLGPTSDAWHQNNPLMKVKFASRNRFLKFRERVIAMKFNAFRHLWRKDMCLHSIKHSSLKSHRKLEVSLRKVGCGYQKPRSTIRSRFSYPTGNLSVVPNSEMFAYTKKLLSTSQQKPLRKTLKMPGMILDDKEKVVSRFISSNGLVEDPLAFEKERVMINPWTSDERETFLDKLVIYGKDFRRIASFLDHKTTADCVEFYYKNHKSESFSKIMRQHAKPSGNKWNRESNASSLDILSAAAGEANGITVQKQMHLGRSLLFGYGSLKTSNCGNGVLERSNSLDVVGDERETVAADVLAGICGSFPIERHRKWIQWPLELDIMQSMDDDTCSDESCGYMDPSDWMDEEKATFLHALSSYGKDFVMISRCLKTRSRDQCKVFFSKARKCLGLDVICSGHQKEESPSNDDPNGGGTDTEDGYAAETGFVGGTNKLGNKMKGMPSSVMIMCSDESFPANHRNLSGERLSNFDVDKVDHEDVDNSVSNLSRIQGFSDAVLDNGDVSGGAIKQPSLALTDKNKTGSVISDSISVDLLDKMVVSSGNSPHSRGCNKDDTEASGVCELKCPDQGLCAVRNGFCPVGDSCSVPNLVPQIQPLENLESMPSPRERSRSSMMSSVLEDSRSVQCGKTECQDQMSSTLELKGSKVSDSCKYVERPNVGQGYPVQVTDDEEVNGDVSWTSSVTGLSLLSRKVEELGDHPKIHSRSLSDSAKLCRNGNVKLFGNILTNSSVQKPFLTSTNELENRSHNKNTGTKSSTLKISSHQNLDGSSAVSKFQRLNDQGHENSLMKMKGLWEGNRTQFGISPLPDSAKYPPAFGYGNERYLNGVSTLGHREKNCSNRVVDCSNDRGRDCQKLPRPLKADQKHRQDTYSETQRRRNGFEAVAGIQHQGKGAEEINGVGVGRPSIVVGVSCPGVSDPVAAIRMHRPNIDQSRSTAKGNESWGGKGKIGR